MATYIVSGIGQHKKFFDSNSYRDANAYIFTPEKAAYIGGANITSSETAAAEMQKVAVAFGKDKGKRLRHSILSFHQSENVTPERANEFAQEIIKHYAPEYQITYAVHNNTDETHIHMVMNQISYVDGHRYEGKKKDYHDFIRHMRQVTHFTVIPGK